jgi:hypothetical protein
MHVPKFIQLMLGIFINQYGVLALFTCIRHWKCVEEKLIGIQEKEDKERETEIIIVSYLEKCSLKIREIRMIFLSSCTSVKLGISPKEMNIN